jgi:hypothetical protein
VSGAFGALKIGNYISINDTIQNNQDRTILKKVQHGFSKSMPQMPPVKMK